MSSTAAVVSLAGIQRFTLFTSLPPEVRFLIWRLSLSPRVVELLSSNICNGFYSQAKLPTALRVCRESRQAVEVFYPMCFGSFLQPERARFNFDLDILYLDVGLEEEALPHLLGVLKEIEVTRLKYVAIDTAYFVGNFDQDLTVAGLKRAVKAMTGLKEIIFVSDITIESIHSKKVIKFYAEHETGKAEPGWPADVEELPDVQEEYSDWKMTNAIKMTAVYGWRPV